MSYHYNEGFENDAYHYSDTLEIDRRPSEKFSVPSKNPYGSDENYSDVRQRRMDYPEAILMASVQPASTNIQHASEHTAPYREPYNGGFSNLGFENENDPPSFISHSQDRYSDSFSTEADDNSKGTTRRNLSQTQMYKSTLFSTARESVNREEKLVLIKKLAGMPSRERIKAIKKLPKMLREKQEIRNRVQLMVKKESKTSGTQISCCADCLNSITVSFRRFKETLSDIKQALQLWQKTLKVIGGTFGTSILSYFIFMRWLLAFNIFSFIINFSFITIPQLVDLRPNNLSFSGLELLTGSGYFQETVLYYGFYTNSTIRKDENFAPYNMQLAYIFIIGLYLMICFLILVYSMAKSFRDNFINPVMYTGNATKLLCSWDFKITHEKAVKLAHQNISTHIKEDLSENQEKLVLTSCQQAIRFLIHLAIWTVTIGMAVGCCAAVYYLCNSRKKLMVSATSDIERQRESLLQPAVISLINLIMPFVFSLFGLIEKFQSPKHQIYTIIFRNVILKLSIIGVLCYYWLQTIALGIKCWESFIGEDIYRLVVFDFIFCLLGSFVGEFLRSIIGTRCCKTLGKPEFDIARNVLDLIYAQTLAWIGIYFSPLLPLIQIIKLFILFYVKKESLRMNCLPPRKAWKASQMTTLFIFLLFFPSFTGVLVVIGVTVWRRTPSEECGPFRGLNVPFDAISNWISTITGQVNLEWVVWIYDNLIKSELFFFILTLLALIITYLYWQIIQGRKIMIKLLQEQIVNGGKDKMFLLQKLHKLQEMDGFNTGHSSVKQYHKALNKSEENVQYSREQPQGLQSGALALAMRARQQADAEEHEQHLETNAHSALALALKARQEAEVDSDDY
uniref:Transmembrane channel-like protein n=1 Tax=Geotrypetes seraphini TaxID=260995 RepID=A0A6P8SRC0_GEOSA|nr:transmembrane channel-like protein 5 isoform X2 [Geotrypetes seraphini]